MSQVEELVCECEKIIKLSDHNSIGWCFSNNFQKFQTERISPLFGGMDLNTHEVDQFINICDCRIDISKFYLRDAALVLGFDFIALSIISTIAFSKGGINSLHILLMFNAGDLLLSALTWILLFLLIVLFVGMLFYRLHVFAWSGLKQKAILMKNTAEEAA